MPNTTFKNCVCNGVDFSYAKLNNASFHGTALYGTNFSFAVLDKADFTNTNITDSQLRSAFSIRGTKLPNGTLGQGHNLVKNGDANCNIIPIQDWQIQYGSIAVIASKKGRNDCQFFLQSLVAGAAMSQRIVMAQISRPEYYKNASSIADNVELQADMSTGVFIELTGITSNRTVIDKAVASKLCKQNTSGRFFRHLDSTNKSIRMMLQRNIDELEVVVRFNGHNNESSNKSSWCDNIELYMDFS